LSRRFSVLLDRQQGHRKTKLAWFKVWEPGEIKHLRKTVQVCN
jgi:hypothetical protein